MYHLCSIHQVDMWVSTQQMVSGKEAYSNIFKWKATNEYTLQGTSPYPTFKKRNIIFKRADWEGICDRYQEGKWKLCLPWFNPPPFNRHHRPNEFDWDPWLRLSMSKGKGTVDWSKLNCVGKMACGAVKNLDYIIRLPFNQLRQKTSKNIVPINKVTNRKLLARHFKSLSRTASSKTLQNTCELASILRVPASVMGVNLRALPRHHGYCWSQRSQRLHEFEKV